jgi:MFS transporter, ACS family, pantothenate transporter
MIFYPVTDAPNYPKGCIASLVTGTLAIPFILLIAWLEKRSRAKGIVGSSIEDTSDDGKIDDVGVKITVMKGMC